MEFRATGENPSNHTHQPPPRPHSSSSLNFLNERVGYTHQDLGRDYFPSPSNMNKSVLREEIIVTDAERRRWIEEEVRRQMMMERAITMRSTFNCNFVMDPRRLPEAEVSREIMIEREMVLQASHAREYSMLSSPSTMRMNPRLPIFNHLDCRSTDFALLNHEYEVRITELKAASEFKKERIIDLPNPEGDVSKLKRKAETPPSTSETKPYSYPTKRPKQALTCEICKISATSEQNLEMHFQGKKHKSKAERQPFQVKGKNFAIGFCSSKAVNNRVKKLEEKPKEEVLKKLDEEKNDDVVNDGVTYDDEGVTVEVSDGVEFLFWCEMCGFGASSEEEMDDHRIGKEHISMRSKAIADRGGNKEEMGL